MASVDPTYPLYPVTCIIVTALLLILLITNAVKNSWNFSITLLTFSLFWELLTLGINAVVWSDNADIKAYVYCDIVSHLQVFVSVVKPACTLIITRRLYRIASMRSVEPSSRREKTFDTIFDWSIGVGLPTLATGVLYYIDQGARFQIFEGYGCSSATVNAGIELITTFSWPAVLPLISTLIYCPKIVYVFYRHSRETNQFLQSNPSITRNSYMRILALACLDIVVTLPLGIVTIVLVANQSKSLPFYPGWNVIHSNWEPDAVTYNELREAGTWNEAQFYFQQWTAPVLGIAVFSLFGLTSEVRATYWRGIVVVGQFLGWTVPQRSHSEPRELSQIHFEQRAINTSDSQPSTENEGGRSLTDKIHGADPTSASELVL